MWVAAVLLCWLSKCAEVVPALQTAPPLHSQGRWDPPDKDPWDSGDLFLRLLSSPADSWGEESAQNMNSGDLFLHLLSSPVNSWGEESAQNTDTGDLFLH